MQDIIIIGAVLLIMGGAIYFVIRLQGKYNYEKAKGEKLNLDLENQRARENNRIEHENQSPNDVVDDWIDS